jgi:hypothetical protein
MERPTDIYRVVLVGEDLEELAFFLDHTRRLFFQDIRE